jgi:hypothetical protein
MRREVFTVLGRYSSYLKNLRCVYEERNELRAVIRKNTEQFCSAVLEIKNAKTKTGKYLAVLVSTFCYKYFVTKCYSQYNIPPLIANKTCVLLLNSFIFIFISGRYSSWELIK